MSLEKTPVRIGVWFEPSHVPYGGPAQVLIGTILGFLQADSPPVILVNEIGDLNWAFDSTDNLTEFEAKTRGLQRAIGPMCFTAGDFRVANPDDHPVWNLGRRGNMLFLAPSAWFAKWIMHGLPFYDIEKHRRPMAIWGAGVDTERFCPPAVPRHLAVKRDFFVYFKSQNWTEHADVYSYIFSNYFKMRGFTISYYFYNHEELRDAAQTSRFCIFMSTTETQGIASLEIMACGCPLFVIDVTRYDHDGYSLDGASSVTCWDDRCGMKSSMAALKEDFPRFLATLDSYTPRAFVEERFSYKVAAGRLRNLLETQLNM
jgi:hypothetical protein